MHFDQDGERHALQGERVARFQNGKTEPRRAPPVGVVLHYTAVMARRRPAADLERKFAAVSDPSVRALVEREGAIPSGLSLCLQNAISPRAASWDFLVGRDGLVVQCNLQLSKSATWHAGRKVARLKSTLKRDYFFGATKVFDHARKEFLHPRLPDGTIMQSGNPPCVGIEIECWGRLHEKNGKLCQRTSKGYTPVSVAPSEVVHVGTALYHGIAEPQMQALIALSGALRDTFGITRAGWYRHREIRPDNRVDPEPPLDVAALLDRLYAPAEPEAALEAIEPGELDPEPDLADGEPDGEEDES